jgi:hypothetical protein
MLVANASWENLSGRSTPGCASLDDADDFRLGQICSNVHEIFHLRPNQYALGEAVFEIESYLTHHSVELGPLVALGTAATSFRFAGAKLSKILGRLGHKLSEELHFDAPEGLACAVSYLLSPKRVCVRFCIPPSATSKKQTGFSKVAMSKAWYDLFLEMTIRRDGSVLGWISLARQKARLASLARNWRAGPCIVHRGSVAAAPCWQPPPPRRRFMRVRVHTTPPFIASHDRSNRDSGFRRLALFVQITSVSSA